MKVNISSPFAGKYPSHIVVPFAKGALTDANKVSLTPAQLIQPVIAATWPDGSIKWLHLYTELQPNIEYEVSMDVQTLPVVPDSKLKVLQLSDGDFQIENGQYVAFLDGITGGLTIEGVCEDAGSFLTDERIISWNCEGTVTLIEQGPVCAIFKIEGWYQTVEKRVAPFCKQVTYITFFNDSPLIKFSHATIFADNMNERSIFQLGYKFPSSVSERIKLTSRDLEQKFPNYIDGNIFYVWPGFSDASQSNETDLIEIYKFRYLNTGPLITTRMPDNYLKAWLAQKDTTECKAEYARNGNMQGIAVHNEFALIIDGVDVDVTDYNLNPIGMVINLETEVFGKVAPVNNDIPEFLAVDKICKDMIRGCELSATRFRAFGMWIFGNSHHDELINEYRPSLHRVWSNNHYQQSSIFWLHAFRSGDYEILRWARRATEYYSSIGQVKYDQLAGYYDGNNVHRPDVPETKFHRPGAFYHCKGVLPWGGRDYGMDSNDVDADLIGHWIDPSSLLYSWVIDANLWSRDAYSLWDTNVRSRLYTSGTRRDVNTTLVHAITLYQHTHDDVLLANINGMIAGLISMPLVDQAPGPIWEPTWLERYYEFNPNNVLFNQYVLTTLQTLLPDYEGIWAISLACLAYRMTNNISYLTNLIPTIQRNLKVPAQFGDSWQAYNFKPGPITGGDRHFCYQWPRLSKALQDAGILTWPSEWPEPGNYANGQCRYDKQWDIDARGTHIMVNIPEGVPQFDLMIDATGASGADCQAAHLQVKDPLQNIALDVPRIPISNYVFNKQWRPTNWRVDRQEYVIQTNGLAGIWEVSLGANELALCAPLTEYHEAQYLQSLDKTGTSETQKYQFKICSLYLLKIVDNIVMCKFVARGKKTVSFLNGDWLMNMQLRETEITDYLKLDIYCEGDAFIELQIECEDRYPLLIGQDLDVLRDFGHGFSLLSK